MTDNNINYVFDKLVQAYSYLSKYPLILSVFKIILQFMSVILLTSLAHWSLVLIYTTYCFGTGFIGAAKNILTLGSPFCQFVNYVQFELSKHYITIWASAAVGVIAWTVARLK